MLDPVLNLAIFIIWWWISFFVMLPIGVRSMDEAGEQAPGHDQGAPAAANLRQKALWALGAAVVLWGITALVIFFDPFNLRPDIGK